MSIYNPHFPHAEETFRLAGEWKDRCLINDGSLLSEEELWTLGNLERCRVAFNENPLEDAKLKYLDKLEIQLADEEAQVKRLMAELHWILCLFPSNMRGAAKIALVEKVWSWSGDALNTNQAALNPQSIGGLGSGGPGFLAHRWRELRFLINACVAFKSLPTAAAIAVVSDPHEFVDWLEGVPDEGDRQLRHMLAHLLFPEHYERISSIGDMRRVLVGFGRFSWQDVRTLSRPATYQALRELRGELEASSSGPIDFYEPHIQERWKDQFTPEWAERLLDEQLVRHAPPTQKIASFAVQPNGLVIALERERTTVRLWLPNIDLPELTGVHVVRRYNAAATRTSNLPQSLSTGHSALYVQIANEEALERLITSLIDEDHLSVEGESQAQFEQPLNQILYGPPGTGKTYQTLTRALQILDPVFLQANLANRKALKARFDELKADGRLAFVTFHQSFSYEDFVEGIRAEVVDGAITYRINDGVLKQLCLKRPTRRIPSSNKFNEYTVLSSSEELLWLRKPNGGDLPVSWRIVDQLVDLVMEGTITVQDVRDGIVFTKVTDSRLERYLVNGYKNVLALIVESQLDGKKVQTGPKVLIIDEINRGDISKILGELITLIEPSRRAGASDETTATLPYSRASLAIPSDLYLIGTMNTADMSLTKVDTALRRRFEFVPLYPDASALEGVIVANVNLSAMLTAMNSRIELLLDQEHSIGHAYFLSCRDNPSLDHLARIFEYQIIPLLQEYFFDDWSKLRYVLNDHRKSSEDDQFVVQTTASVQELLGDVEGLRLPENRWRINKEALLRPSAFALIVGQGG